MDAIRDVLKLNLGRSLRALNGEDRLASAWVVACGRALAGRGEIVGYANGVVEVQVASRPWLEQFRSMHADLCGELSRIAGLPVTGIHFVVKR